MDRLALLPGHRLRPVLALLCALAGVFTLAAPARASQAQTLTINTGSPAAVDTDVALPQIPTAVNNFVYPNMGISPAKAVKLAEATPQMQAIHRAHHPLHFSVTLMPKALYEVDFSFHNQPEAAVLVVRGGYVGHIYTGAAVTAAYARGNYSPTFDSPLVWGAFGLMFLLPLALLRGRSWLSRLDLAVVLTFGLSYLLFDQQHIEPAVWLAYPPLVYLLVRLLVRGLRGSRERGADEPAEVGLPTWALVAGLVVLVAGRIAVTLLPKLEMDVAYASLIGAYKILHGQSIYFASIGHPDTYGPVAYLAYVPFEAIWPIKTWFSYLPAARAATITFDLLTIGGLLMLGMRLQAGRAGRRLGLLLAWLWAACPFTVLGLAKGTNDGLTALFAVLVMLAWSAPVRRGVVLGLATAAKFFPAVLLALVAARHRAGEQAAPRKVIAGFAIAAGAAVALLLPPGGIREMWDHTLGYQLTRPDVFSPWALHHSLTPIKDALELAGLALAVVVALRPRGPLTTARLAALAGALTIAVQLPALHWSYLYIVWFWPFVLIAVLAGGGKAAAARRAPERTAAQAPLEFPDALVSVP